MQFLLVFVRLTFKRELLSSPLQLGINYQVYLSTSSVKLIVGLNIIFYIGEAILYSFVCDSFLAV